MIFPMFTIIYVEVLNGIADLWGHWGKMVKLIEIQLCNKIATKQIYICIYTVYIYTYVYTYVYVYISIVYT